MRIYSALLGCISLAGLSACATIVEGSNDTIQIATVPPTNAQCTLTNKRGSYTTMIPSPASVQKSRTDLNVVCLDPASGAQGKSTIVSGMEPWAFGNIIIGGLLGLGIDWSTGSAYNYPDSTTVTMQNLAPVAAPIAEPMAMPAASPMDPLPTQTTPSAAMTTAPVLAPEPSATSTGYVAPVPVVAPAYAPATMAPVAAPVTPAAELPATK